MEQVRNNQPAAIVIGDGLNALGVVRSLGCASVPLIVLGQNASAPAQHSRYGRKVKTSSLEGESLVDALRHLAAGCEQPPILFVTEEKTVRTVSEQRHIVQKFCRIVLPEHARLMALMHKHGFQQLAEAEGARIPRLANLRSSADLEVLESLRYPCVLKPAKKDYAYGARFKKAYVVNSAAEARTLYAEIAPVLADIVVQEWIDGNDSDIYFCLQYLGDDGRLVASFAGRKIRAWPPAIGGTASCLPAWEHAEELEHLTYDFFQRVQFVGMGSMEFKRDRRDGRFYMIEPTVARTDFQEEVATVNGVNIPLAAYLHEADLPLQPAFSKRSRRIWREPVTDRWSMQTQGVDKAFADLAICDAYWRWHDPAPWWNFMHQRVKRRWHAVRRGLQGTGQ